MNKFIWFDHQPETFIFQHLLRSNNGLFFFSAWKRSSVPLPDEDQALLAATGALLLSACTLEVVIEGDLAAHQDVLHGKQAHHDLRPNLPLVSHSSAHTSGSWTEPGYLGKGELNNMSLSTTYDLSNL